MSASKLKNRRRFITRDTRLDIPEEGELKLTSTEGASEEDESLVDTLDTNSLDRTWPRRSWHHGSHFAPVLGFQGNFSSAVQPRVNPRQEDPLYPVGNSQMTPGHRLRHHQPSVESVFSFSGQSSPRCDNEWRYRSHSATASTPCLANLPLSLLKTTSEVCLESKCHDDVIDDVTAFKESLRNGPPSGVGSVPEMSVIPCAQTTSGLETKRRSQSLNETSGSRPFLIHPRSPQSPRPGSVLHRALAWEMAGRSQAPLRVGDSPARSPRMSNDRFQENSLDQTHQTNRFSSTGNGILSRTDEPISPSRLSTGPELRGHSTTPANAERFQLLVPAYGDPMQFAPTKSFRHSFDLGRSSVQRNASDKPHGVERVGSARVSPVSDNSGFRYFPSWGNPQNKTEIQITPPLEPPVPKDQKFLVEPETTTLTSGGGFQKPFRSKSLKLLTFDPVGISSDDPDKLTSVENTVTSPPSLSINRTTEKIQIGKENLKPKPFLSMLTLTNEMQEESEETLNPPSRYSNLATQSTGNSTGKLTVADQRNFGASYADDCDFMTPSAGEFRQECSSISQRELSNSLTGFVTPLDTQINPAENSQSSLPLFRPIGSNLVVKRLTNLTKNPFAPISKHEQLREPTKNTPTETPETKQELNSGSTGSRIIGSFGVNSESQSPTKTVSRLTLPSDSQPFSPGKSAPTDKAKLSVYESSNSEISKSEKSTKLSAAGDDVQSFKSAGQKNLEKHPNFTSTKELFLENSSLESISIGNAEKVGKSSVEPTPSTQQPGGRLGADKSSSRLNGETPTRMIRVFLKSSTQLKDEAVLQSPINRTGRVQIGAVELVQAGAAGQVGTGHPVQSDKLDIDESVAKELDSKINDAKVEKIPTNSFDFSFDFPTIQPTDPGPLKKNSKIQSIPFNIRENTDKNFVMEKSASRSENHCNDKGNNDNPVKHVVGSNRCFLEMKSDSSTATSRKPFEIVKKKLIIPEPMPWFRSKEETKPSETVGAKGDSSFHFGRSGSVVNGNEIESISRPIDFTNISSKCKSIQRSNGADFDSLTSQSVPTTLDRKKPGAMPAHAAAVKCSDLEMALRKIESDMNIIARAGAKTCPGVPKNNHPDPLINKNISKENLKYISGGFSPTTNRRSSLFTCSSEYNEALRRLQGSRIPLGASSLEWRAEGPGSPPCPTENHGDGGGGIRPSSSSSITTELDRAIEMLTSAKPTEKKSTWYQADDRTGGNRMPLRTPEPKMDFSSSPSSFPSSAYFENGSTETNRQSKVSSTEGGSMERYTSPIGSSCASIESVQAVKVNPMIVEPEVVGDRRVRRLMVLAREDSFNRPDSPLFRKTLPLPKDSVIMRHRMHQKELRCEGVGGGGGSGRGSVSSSSSETSDDESPMLRLAPKRTKKSRSVPANGTPEVDESSDRNDERDSIFSSTTSIRPLSVDGSLLSEENL